MLSNKKIAVIIPALNEEKTLPAVLNDIPGDLVDEVVVIDNGSSDKTPEIAKERGATLLFESRRGYGYPCLRGIEYLKTKNPDIVVFLDGNYSDHPDEIIKLVEPVVRDDYDLVCGSRIMGKIEEGALRVPVRFGNLLATVLIRLFYGFKYTDVGPFRAIKFAKLLELDMNDNLGWTIEMQVKAVRSGYRITEVPVNYRAGTGKSKITGNIKGIAVVGYRIIRAIFKNLFFSPARADA
ncbi:MAG TPA: glycosyltransferase family 2 protein [Nitrospirae bacterium]|nr:undecaprenyl-phosphate mannosyltransferase [bacterium BMS3Abin06]HDH11830.1 glycosyltransferase family 2 protein [Nitrospirota bacterium]HDZ02828.1 glycosyltransferase family 2 protein [Nitrospirota bacterium]